MDDVAKIAKGLVERLRYGANWGVIPTSDLGDFGIFDEAATALAEKDATIANLAKAVIELSDNVHDRDGLSNHAEIAVDIARTTLAKHGGNNG